MKSFVELPLVRELHARELLLPVAVCLLALGVLTHGALNREPEPEPAEAQMAEPVTAPAAPAVARPDLENTPLSYFSDYWRQLSERSRERFIRIRGRYPAVVVAPGLAMSSLRSAMEEEAVRTDAAAGGAEDAGGYKLALVDAEHGVALYELSQPYQATHFALVDSANMAPGSLIAAVGIDDEDRPWVAPGHLRGAATAAPQALRTLQERPLDTSIQMPPLLGAAAVVDLDSELLGVAVQLQNGPAMLSAEAILHVVERYRRGEPCRAVRTVGLAPRVGELLGIPAGVVIESVFAGGFLPEPSLQAGDILIEWNGKSVDSPEKFTELYDASEAGELTDYVIVRDGRRRRGRTRAPGSDCLPVEERSFSRFASAGLTLRRTADSEGGWSIVDVREGSLAAAALQAGDRIEAALGSAAGDVENALAAYEKSPRPVVLRIMRGGRSRLGVIEPPPGPPVETAPEAATTSQ